MKSRTLFILFGLFAFGLNVVCGCEKWSEGKKTVYFTIKATVNGEYKEYAETREGRLEPYYIKVPFFYRCTFAEQYFDMAIKDMLLIKITAEQLDSSAIRNKKQYFVREDAPGQNSAVGAYKYNGSIYTLVSGSFSFEAYGSSIPDSFSLLFDCLMANSSKDTIPITGGRIDFYRPFYTKNTLLGLTTWLDIPIH